MVTVTLEKVEKMSWNLLRFHTKGVISQCKRIATPCFEFRLFDITGAAASQGVPVFCVLDDMQEDDSIAFRLKRVFPRSLDPGSGSPDWIELGLVPTELLVFPNQGIRRIKATLRVTEGLNGQLIAAAETVWNTTVLEMGYLDEEEHESEAQGASLKLAMCIAAADGVVEDGEVTVIKEWGERSVRALPAARQAGRRSVLNKALQEATREIRANRVPALEADAIEVLLEKGVPRYCYEAYELSLHVLRADGEAHPAEMAHLTRLARALDLDDTKVRIMTDKHLADVQFTPLQSDSDDDHILGLTKDMSPEDIRKHLNKLYSKQVARTQHSSPEVKAKAEDLIERIVKARVRHLGQES